MNDYFAELKNNKQNYIVDLIKNTDDLSKLTGEDLVKTNQQARASALAHNEAIKTQTLSAKAGKVALQALETAGNMLLMWVITEVITLFHDLATASDRLKESAEELGSALSSTRSDFEDYKKRINELQDVNQETYDARQQLLGIQDELIEKYGDEAETIRLVTEAINGNNDALNELSQNKA